MAKSGLWLRGAKGKLAGTVISKGANGATVLRELVTPKNPKTEAQATQRMKMAACCNFYRGLSQILDHSFEGVKYGNPSRMFFMKQALASDLTVAAVERGSKEFTPLPLNISVGSLWAPTPIVEDYEFKVRLTRAVTSADKVAITNSRDAALPVLADLFGVEMGSQLTFVICDFESNIPRTYIHRLILKSGVDDDFNGLAFESLDTNDLFYFPPYSDTARAMGVIVSKEVDGKWLRSTSPLVISESLNSEVYNAVAVEAVKASYMQKQSASVNDEYLNEGGIGNGSIIYVAMNDGTYHPVGYNFSTSQATAVIKLKLSNASQFSIDKLSIENGKYEPSAIVIKGNDVTIGIASITTTPCKLKYNGVSILSIVNTQML